MSAFFGSMVGRVFLILVGGVLASAALTALLANHQRQEFLAHVRTLHAAERAEQLVLMLDALPPSMRPGVAAAASGNGLVVEISAAESNEGETDSAFAAALRERIGQDHRIKAKKTPCVMPPEFANALPQQPQPLCRSASITLRDGTPLHLVLPSRHVLPAALSVPQWLLYALLFATCVGLLAYAVARMATRPLRQLAQAATELGRNIEQPPLAERGPTEVRHAASAFNNMQAQLRRYLQERTQMLAAITHDLQTPLTRIRLRLEKVADNELRERLVDDLFAIQGMIRDGLDLARSMNSAEPMQRTDFDSILDSVCADAAEAGQDVTLSGLTGASIMAQPGALRRCLTNLIDNAVKYGGNARVSAAREDSRVVVRVQDGGPGIPEALLGAVFDPFFRIESSRSRDTGGTGIGLTIARNIAEKHGGKLSLQNHPDGGVVALLELPAG